MKDEPFSSTHYFVVAVNVKEKKKHEKVAKGLTTVVASYVRLLSLCGAESTN